MLKFFEGVKNVAMMSDVVTDQGTFQAVRLQEYSKERWNQLAEKTNTASFIRLVGRDPINYEEVRSWVRTLCK